MIDLPSLLATPVEGPLSQGDAALLIRYREAIRELAAAAEKAEQAHRAEIARLDLALAKERDDNGHLRRFLAAETEQCQRLGADNVRRMQRLGVKYPDGLDSGIDRLEAERDAHRSMLCDLLASAHPHPMEHPTMARQWRRARRLLRFGSTLPDGCAGCAKADRATDGGTCFKHDHPDVASEQAKEPSHG
jgi:hypothetical protein